MGRSVETSESAHRYMVPLEEQMPERSDRQSKLLSVEEAGEIIASKDTISLAGSHSVDGAMALVRAAISAGASDMTMIPPVTTSIAADLPIAAGMVSKLYLSYVGFEFLGMAPAFRQAAEAGELEVVEADEPFIILGTRAAAGGRPFAVVKNVYEATDHPELNPELETVTDPFTGEEAYAIPALHSDVFVMHAQVADPYGNCQVWGGSAQERDKAKAADTVIVQTDEIVESDVITRDPSQTTVPGKMVDHVVHAPFGAHPTFSSSNYAVDQPHLERYVEMVRDGRADEYLETYVHDPVDHYAYLDEIGGLRRKAELRRLLANPTGADGGEA